MKQGKRLCKARGEPLTNQGRISRIKQGHILLNREKEYTKQGKSLLQKKEETSYKIGKYLIPNREISRTQQRKDFIQNREKMQPAKEEYRNRRILWIPPVETCRLSSKVYQ